MDNEGFNLDDDLIIDGRDITAEVFERVYRAGFRPLLLYAYGFVMDEAEAENIVQSVFTTMWEMRHRLPERLRVKAYLYSSVKHACLRYFQRLRLLDEYKKRQAEALVLSLADEEDSGEEDEEVARSVRAALEKLTDQQRKIVELHVQEGKKYGEIADILQLSENTVRTHLKRAYKILRDNLSCFFPFLF